MQTQTLSRYAITLFILCTLGFTGTAVAGAADPHSHSIGSKQDVATEKQAIRNLITTMNEAVSHGDITSILSTFNSKALKLDLFPAHSYHKANTTQQPTDVFPKTADLGQRWKVVIGILSGQEKYQRQAENIRIEVDGALASAWVDVATRAITKDGDTETSNRFTEIVLLKKAHGKWKIVLISNNRGDR